MVFRSKRRNSMGEIGWSVFRSKRRNSMGEIGLGAVWVSEIFLEITPKSSGGPPTNSSALKEISIFQHRNTQHAKWDQKARRVSPEIFTSAAGAIANAFSDIHAQLDSCPARGLSRNPSHTLFYRNSGIFHNRCHGATGLMRRFIGATTHGGL